jgi:hypothetical protein
MTGGYCGFRVLRSLKTDEAGTTPAESSLGLTFSVRGEVINMGDSEEGTDQRTSSKVFVEVVSW